LSSEGGVAKSVEKAFIPKDGNGNGGGGGGDGKG
jgi:hypothetical protein